MQLVNVPFSTPDQSHIARMSYNFIIPVLIQIFSFSKFAPVKIYHDIRTGWRLWKEAMITFHKASLCKEIMEHISLLKISTFYWARSEASKGYVFTGICLSKCNMGPGNNTSLPPDYVQAGGTHPTGMHSCFASAKIYSLCNWLFSLKASRTWTNYHSMRAAFKQETHSTSYIL